MSEVPSSGDDFEPVDPQQTFNDYVRVRILHVLGVYPKLSLSMLQVGIGTSLSPKLWKGVLDKLVADKIVDVKQVTVVTPTGRAQVHTIVSLAQRTN